MNPASLHYWFKAVTTMSTVQFQKRLRLQEVRRILMVKTSMRVSYRKFSGGLREPLTIQSDYKRLFGLPPRKNIEHLHSVSGGVNAIPRELSPQYETGIPIQGEE